MLWLTDQVPGINEDYYAKFCCIWYCDCRGELGTKEDVSSVSSSYSNTGTNDDVLKSNTLPNLASNPCSHSCLHSNNKEVHRWHYEKDQGSCLQIFFVQNSIFIGNRSYSFFLIHYLCLQGIVVFCHFPLSHKFVCWFCLISVY